MARRVDEIELVFLATPGGVRHPYRVQLDGYPALTLEVQRIQHLSFHLPLLQHARGFDQPIGECRLAVVDMRDDAEVADVLELQEVSLGCAGC